MDAHRGTAETEGTSVETGFKSWLRRRLAKLRGQHGSAMIEIALVLPILLLVVTGIVNVGLMVFNYLSLTNATQMAAEQVAISRALTNDPCALAVNTVVAAEQGLNTTALGYQLTINGTVYNGTTCTAGNGTLRNAQYDPMRLKVTYPCSLKVYGATLISNCTMTSVMSETIQ